MELKFEINCYTAIEGLDDAVIGTASNSSADKEVLAYDFEKAVQILADLNWTKEEVEEWLEHCAFDSDLEDQPVFVYRDDNVREQLKRRHGGRKDLH